MPPTMAASGVAEDALRNVLGAALGAIGSNGVARPTVAAMKLLEELRSTLDRGGVTVHLCPRAALTATTREGHYVRVWGVVSPAAGVSDVTDVTGSGVIRQKSVAVRRSLDLLRLGSGLVKHASGALVKHASGAIFKHGSSLVRHDSLVSAMTDTGSVVRHESGIRLRALEALALNGSGSRSQSTEDDSGYSSASLSSPGMLPQFEAYMDEDTPDVLEVGPFAAHMAAIGSSGYSTAST